MRRIAILLAATAVLALAIAGAGVADELPPLSKCLDVEVYLDHDDPVVLEDKSNNLERYGVAVPDLFAMIFSARNRCPDMVKVQFSYVQDWWTRPEHVDAGPCEKGLMLLAAGEFESLRKQVVNPGGPMVQTFERNYPDPAYETVSCYFLPTEGEAPRGYDCKEVAPVRCP